MLLAGLPEQVRRELSVFLRSAEIRQESLASLEKTIERLHQLPFPILLLGWPLRTRQDANLLARLRRLPSWIPVLAVGEIDAPGARIEALERGADFLLPVRGFQQELLAILESLGRRCDRMAPALLDSLPLAVDPRKRIVRWGKREAVLTPTEFAIAAYLFRNPGRVVLIQELAMQLHRHAPGGSRSPRLLHAHLVHLRRKLSQSATGIRLRPVRGKGVVLEWKPGWPRRES